MGLNKGEGQVGSPHELFAKAFESHRIMHTNKLATGPTTRPIGNDSVFPPWSTHQTFNALGALDFHA